VFSFYALVRCAELLVKQVDNTQLIRTRDNLRVGNFFSQASKQLLMKVSAHLSSVKIRREDTLQMPAQLL